MAEETTKSVSSAGSGLTKMGEIPVGDSQHQGTGQWDSESQTDGRPRRYRSAGQKTHWIDDSVKSEQTVFELQTAKMLAEHLLKQAVALNDEIYWKPVGSRRLQNQETNPLLNVRLQIIEEKVDGMCRMVQQLILLVKDRAHTDDETLSRMTEREVLGVSKELGYRWRNVGRLLGVSNSIIEEISYRHPSSLQEQAYQCLWTWFRSDGSRRKLYQALQEEGLTDVVEKFHQC